MKRKQFFAELNQYLSFLSPEDTAEILDIYNKMFDDAGEEGEEALMISLGTPMMITINLKRRLESGKPLMPGMKYKKEIENDVDKPITNSDTPSVVKTTPASNFEGKAEETVKPTQDKPLVDDKHPEETGSKDKETEVNSQPNVIPESNNDTEKPPESETEDIKFPKDDEEYTENTDPISDVEALFGKNAEQYDQPRVQDDVREKSTGKIIALSFISIVVAAVFLITASVGGIMIFALQQCIVAVSTGTISNINDILMLLGGGIVIGGVGLFLVWISIWAAIHIIAKMFANALGRDYEDGVVLRKIWSIVAIISIALVVLGIIACAISLLSDGNVDRLRLNESADFVFRRFSTDNLITSFKTIFGF